MLKKIATGPSPRPCMVLAKRKEGSGDDIVERMPLQKASLFQAFGAMRKERRVEKWRGISPFLFRLRFFTLLPN